MWQDHRVQLLLGILAFKDDLQTIPCSLPTKCLWVSHDTRNVHSWQKKMSDASAQLMNNCHQTHWNEPCQTWTKRHKGHKNDSCWTETRGLINRTQSCILCKWCNRQTKVHTKVLDYCFQWNHPKVSKGKEQAFQFLKAVLKVPKILTYGKLCRAFENTHVPMDVSYPDDSYPSWDDSYPTTFSW